MTSVLLCLFCVFSLFTIPSSSSSLSTITLSLTPILNPNRSSSNQWEFISNIARSTLARAHHLKNTTSSLSSSVLRETESSALYPRSYGGYSVSLSFGTPAQSIKLVFDTGSSLLWVPCTSRYLCSNCSFSHVEPTQILTFKPKLSSSYRIIGCLNPKCSWIFSSDLKDRCPDCGLNSNPANCTKPCPSYFIQYGLGWTSGIALSDNLDFPSRAVRDFFFGCSVISDRSPEGIAGFGRAQSSLPNQLKLSKFSYCLVSHKFDDQPKSSDLILAGDGNSAGDGGVGLSYTPLGKNPGKPPYDEYYYVYLRKITVGDKKVKLPYGLLKPGPKGNGGTIVDSGTTLTFMDRALFDPVVAEFTAQMDRYKRDKEAEARSNFGLCFDLSGEKNISIPELAFEFKGGAKMELAVENYFSFVGKPGSCLTIISGPKPVGPDEVVGPAILIGNYLQMDFYIEYDLKNERFGFKKHKCG